MKKQKHIFLFVEHRRIFLLPPLFPILKNSLYQNYTDLFNPSTTIRHFLSPNPSPIGKANGVKVLLKVNDQWGQEVATSENEMKQPEIHEAHCNVVGAASRIYFHRLMVGEFVETKKLMLFK